MMQSHEYPGKECLWHLRRLRDFKLLSPVLWNFHTCTTESILTGSIPAWFENSTQQARRALQVWCDRLSAELPDLQSSYNKWYWNKARKIIKDLSHLNSGVFTLVRSVKCFCISQTIQTSTRTTPSSIYFFKKHMNTGPGIVCTAILVT